MHKYSLTALCRKSSLESKPPPVPPILEEEDFYTRMPSGYKWEKHQHFDRCVFRELELCGFGRPTPDDVRNNPALAARLMLSIFSTRVPGYQIREEFYDVRNIMYLPQHYPELRELLALSLEDGSFALLRSAREFSLFAIRLARYSTNGFNSFLVRLIHSREAVAVEYISRCFLGCETVCRMYDHVHHPAPPDIAEVMQKHAHRPGVRIRVNKSNMGASSSGNRALEESSAEWVRSVNDDVTLREDLLTELEIIMRAHPDAYAISKCSRLPSL